jgi:hypothetical protein
MGTFIGLHLSKTILDHLRNVFIANSDVDLNAANRNLLQIDKH